MKYWRNAKVDQAQAQIVEALRACGDKVYFIGQPVDLLVRTGRRYWTCEVKTPGKNAKRRQQSQIDHARDALEAGAPHFVVQSVEEVIARRNQMIDDNK